MAGLVPAIHDFTYIASQDVDASDIGERSGFFERLCPVLGLYIKIKRQCLQFLNAEKRLKAPLNFIKTVIR